MEFNIQPLLPNIYSGLIVSAIIFIFLVSIKRIGKFIAKALERFSIKFNESVYTEASKNDHAQISGHNTYLITVFIFFFWIVILTSLYITNSIATNSVEKMVAKTNQIDKQLKNVSPDNKKLTGNIENVIKATSRMKYITYFISVLFIIYTIGNIVELEKVLRIKDLSVNFNKTLSIIRPSIAHGEYLNLKRDWALMKTKEDWNIINNKIESLLKEALLNLS